MPRWRKIRWFGGAISAVSFLGLLQTVIVDDFTKYIFPVDWLLRNWNYNLGLLGSFLGKFPYFPKFSSGQLNLFIVGMASFPSLLIAKFLRFKKTVDTTTKGQFFSATNVLLMLVLFVSFIYLAGDDIGYTKDASDRLKPLRDHEKWFYGQIIPLVMSGYFLFFMYQNRPSSFRGVFFVLSFLATLEIIYLINSEAVVDFLDEWGCSSANPSPHCQN